jgi:hypothetical protein
VEVKNQFHALASVDGERRHCASRVGAWMNHMGRRNDLGNSIIFCSYQNRNADISARRISSVLSSIIIVTSYFGLTVLVLEELTLNYEWYIKH